MAITCKERPKQTGELHFTRPAKTREYWVSGTLDLVDVLRKLAEVSPAVDSFIDVAGAESAIYRAKVSAREVGGGVWDGVVSYEGHFETFEMDFSIGTQNVKQYLAKEQIKTYDCIRGLSAVPGGDYSELLVPDFDKQIHVTATSVDGADFEFPKVDFTITKKLVLSDLDADYVQTVMAMTPSTNAEAWSLTWRTQVFTWEANTLLFRGATLKQNTQLEVAMTFNFSYSKNITEADELFIGESQAIEKKGWEYSWPWMQIVAESGNPRPQTVGVIVVRVYEANDFGDLRIQ